MNDNGTPVSRTELRAELRASLAEFEVRIVDRLHEALATKADVDDVAVISTKLTNHGNRIRAVEQTMVTRDALAEEGKRRFTVGQKIIALGLTAVNFLLVLYSSVINSNS